MKFLIASCLVFGLSVNSRAQSAADERAKIGLPRNLCYELILGQDSRVSELASALASAKLEAALINVVPQAMNWEEIYAGNPASAEIIQKYSSAVHLHVVVGTYEDLAKSMLIEDQLKAQKVISVLGRKDFQKDCK